MDCLVPVRFNNDLSADGILVALYAGLIERAGTLILLIENGRGYGVSAVFRSLLETYVEFHNLNSDPTYLNFIHATFYARWVRLLSNANSNPFLKGLVNAGHDKTTLLDHRRRLFELNQQGYSPLKVVERFKKAGMEAEYRSIYALESSEVHSDLSNLFRNHLTQINGKVEVHIYRERSPDEFTAIMDSSASLLLKASVRLHERLKSGNESPILSLLREYEERHVRTSAEA